MKLRKYRYRSLPHLQKEQRPIFVTFNTNNKAELAPAARDLVLACCLHQHKQMFWLYAVVVMPEHVHMILSPGRADDGSVYSVLEVMQNIKGVSAHQVNESTGRKGKLWQSESFDHILRSSESLEAKIDYIVENPVRRRLGDSGGDYKWLWVNPESSG